MITTIGITLLVLSYIANSINFAFHKEYSDDGNDFVNIMFLVLTTVINILAVMLLINAYE